MDASVDEALRVLELWIPVDPSVQTQATMLKPGDRYVFKYSSFKPGDPPIEASLTYDEVRSVIAKLVLKGLIK